jgi:hypothetical protein
MPSRAALDVWAVEHEGLPFNDPTPASAEFTKPVDPEPDAGTTTPGETGGTSENPAGEPAP